LYPHAIIHHVAKRHSAVLVAGLCGEARETEAVRMMQGVVDSQ